jgi:transcriptional regulator NrdR family protein
MNLEVVKRDRSKEDYSENKVIRITQAAGLEQNQAQDIASKITKWFQENSQTTVTSIQIRDKLLDELKRVNRYAADLYLWYENTKEKPPKR